MQTEKESARHWDVFAEDCGNNRWAHFGSEQFVRMCGGDQSVVEVRLTEDPDGEYDGWLDAGEDTPCLIWNSYVFLDMCFPYGIQAAIDKGRGVVVRLRCQPLAVADVHNKTESSSKKENDGL